MNTTNLPTSFRSKSARPASAASAAETFVTPHFDTQTQPNAMRIQVWVPGVKSSGVEISTRGTQLTITARKAQVLRSNWRTLHIESAQRNYQLSLRLGRSLDLNLLTAKLNEGILHIDVPYLSVGTDDLPKRPEIRSAA